MFTERTEFDHFDVNEQDDLLHAVNVADSFCRVFRSLRRHEENYDTLSTMDW